MGKLTTPSQCYEYCGRGIVVLCCRDVNDSLNSWLSSLFSIVCATLFESTKIKVSDITCFSRGSSAIQKLGGSIPGSFGLHVKCPWVRYWTPNCLLMCVYEFLMSRLALCRKCVNVWMLTCVVKVLWIIKRQEKHCIHTVHLPKCNTLWLSWEYLIRRVLIFIMYNRLPCNGFVFQLLWSRNSCRHWDDHSDHLLQPGAALPLHRQAATRGHRQPHAQTNALQVRSSDWTSICHGIVHFVLKQRNHCW